MVRKLGKGTEKYTQVFACDEKGAGNANHQYSVSSTEEPSVVLGAVHFQTGPIKEAGVNGVMNEDLLAILIDRLDGFQLGDYKCSENAMALTRLQEAQMWLEKRTKDRERRNVEGTSAI